MIQLAISDAVFLLDMLALPGLLNEEDDWRHLVQRVFSSDEIQILGNKK